MRVCVIEGISLASDPSMTDVLQDLPPTPHTLYHGLTPCVQVQYLVLLAILVCFESRCAEGLFPVDVAPGAFGAHQGCR